MGLSDFQVVDILKNVVRVSFNIEKRKSKLKERYKMKIQEIIKISNILSRNLNIEESEIVLKSIEGTLVFCCSK